VPEIVSLAEDPAWRVRRHAAWNMRLVFKNVGGSGRLFDAFLRLTEVRWVETYAHGIFWVTFLSRVGPRRVHSFLAVFRMVIFECVARARRQLLI
jgi:hypothetical protein